MNKSIKKIIKVLCTDRNTITKEKFQKKTRKIRLAFNIESTHYNKE